ncbi:Ribosomal S3Ae family protein [uncultured archaeon]|nr:Ribosomal S3Ae family protein [uncultured archaeon]
MAIKKKFIDVEIPALGESMPVLGAEETLAGRTIKLDLSRKLRGRGLEAVFTIMNKDGKLVAYPKSLILMRSYVQRMMRKRISYVEDSFTTTCKDVKITMKPFLITRKKVSRAIRNNLRRTAREFLLEYVKDKTYMDIAMAILSNDLQKEMHPKLKKVYPLSMCEIRVLETTELAKADLTIKQREVKQVAKAETQELTQAEEIELHLKKKAEAQQSHTSGEETAAKEAEAAKAEEVKTEEKPKKAKKEAQQSHTLGEKKVKSEKESA